MDPHRQKKPALNSENRKPRIEILDAWRGLAALSVCFYHFGRGLPDGFFKEACTFGNLGVDVFFVISGFVIPLWLDRAGGSWGDIPLFLWKRFIRLYPAFLFASLCSLGLWWGSGLIPGFRGEPVGISGTGALANLFFLCDIVGQPWIVPVSWSLAIEWQYYLAAAVSFFFLCRSTPAWRLVTIVLWILASFIPLGKQWLPAYGGVFALGFVSFLHWKGELSRKAFLLLALLAGAAHGAQFGAAAGFIGVSAALGMLVPWRGPASLRFLGEISYSLYLTHVLIGGRVINLGLRFPEEWPTRSLFFFTALAGSIFFAWGFYKIVEKPSHLASQKIKAKAD